MSDITLSKAVRSNLLNLQSTAGLLSKSQERLSTGLRVNSALDNPTNFFTAQGLNSRASDLSQLLDAVSNAVQTVAAADKGISAITKLVESAQATARQALQTSATLPATAAVNAVVTSGNTTSTTISASVSQVTASDATGNLTSFTVSDGVTESLATDASNNLTSFTVSDGVTAEVAAITGGSNFTSVDVSGGDKSFTIDIGAGAVTVNLAQADSGGDDAFDAAEIQTQIDAALGGSNIVNVTGGGGSAPLTFTRGGTAGVASEITVAGTDVTDLGFTSGQTDTGVDEVDDTSGSFIINGRTVALAAGDDATAIFNKINTQAGLSTGTDAFTVSNSGGTLTLTGTDGNDLVISGLTADQASALGFANGTVNGTPEVADTSGSFTINGRTVALAAGDDATAIFNKINTQAGLSTGTDAFTVSNSSGTLTISGANGNDLVIGGLTADQASALGLANGTTNGTPGSTGSADSFTINGQNVTLAGGDDAADILAAIQGAATGSSGTNAFTVSNNAGVLTLTGTAGNDVVIAGLSTEAATALGLQNGTTDGTPAASATPNPKRAELVATYNDLLGQIDALAKDSGFNGVNLLADDDLSVLFNEDGSSSLQISGVDNDAAGLGLTALGTTGFDTNTSINSTLDGLKAAIETLRGQSAKFGSNLSVVETRQDFTKNMINVLQTGAANLTLADTNEEAANVLALQTRQQLSSTALSLASQADQNVLRLF